MKEPQRMIRNCLFLLIWHGFFRWAGNNYDLSHVEAAFHFLFGYFGIKKRIHLLRDVLKIHICHQSDVRRLSWRWWIRGCGLVGLLSPTFSQYLTWVKVAVLILDGLLSLRVASALLCWLRLVPQLVCQLLLDDHERRIPRLFLLRCHFDLLGRIPSTRALVDFV